ncbi:hypothetical protein [Ferrimonas marina]|uniref:Uncharacterized protein n=1 Tax=Ferrimonas marina TaxID=299255 RepID=A0A1M5TCZ9_9GAMM|nr:hypothetical protein [Ferrimonas marina]SHH48223.1 hypothetical protein SAMN02745129_2077 [Ferrimonas marina]
MNGTELDEPLGFAKRNPDLFDNRPSHGLKATLLASQALSESLGQYSHYKDGSGEPVSFVLAFPVHLESLLQYPRWVAAQVDSARNMLYLIAEVTMDGETVRCAIQFRLRPKRIALIKRFGAIELAQLDAFLEGGKTVLTIEVSEFSTMDWEKRAEKRETVRW